ncbi:hypothetical protein, partial [Endozoicomonas sp. ONNA2]|uniref:hypothetical protein n=1 Tax=Endozoicomonas sp. ONNA2 TaxID=2828741 RepID=UPI0021490351
MQPFSSTRAPLSSDVTNNPCLNQPESTNPVGKLGNFAVVQSAVTSFFSSLSPNYIPEHQRQIRQPTAD